MTYNPEGAKEGSTLPPDLILDGTITDIKDGTVKEFVQSPEALKKWKKPEGKAIQVSIEAVHEGKSFQHQKLFTYANDSEGHTTYTARSDLGKFAKKYGSLPKVQGKVKLLTTAEGYLRLKLD